MEIIQIVPRKIGAICRLAVLGAVWLGLNAMGSAEPESPSVSSQLMIEPSSSSLAGGTAKLEVGTLSRSGATYVGDYEIKVMPYFFKNEEGRLSMDVSEPVLQEMMSGKGVNFTGLARKNGSEITHKITAKVTPSGDDHGTLTFAIATDSGSLVFNTTYRLLRPEAEKDRV